MLQADFIKFPIGLVTAFLLCFSTVSCTNKAGNQDKPDLKTAEEIEQEVKTDSASVEAFLKREPVFDEDSLIRRFYHERDYRLAWFKGSKLIPQADKFIEVINSAHQEGLNPRTYQLKNFTQMYDTYANLPKNSEERRQKQIDLDLSLTGTYFTYSRDYYKGLVNPREIQSIEWKVKKNKFKPIKALQTILRERESRYPYYQFAPLHKEYSELRDVLAKYRAMHSKGGWPEVPEVKALKLGDSSEVVPVLRKRLAIQLGTNTGPANSLVFDETLDQAVKKFQEMHGLKPDGVVGGNTLKTLNVSLTERIDQIILNMERWRWVPKRLPERHIMVNVPEYHMYAIENGEKMLDMRVIVGKSMHSTPVFSDKLEYIVFSPYWNITENILFDEVIPAQLRNPNFMASQDMEVVKDLGKNKVDIIPIHSIDWGSVNRETFKYRVRQRPGDKNPLGNVKFIFPNSFDVYLHDTPNDALFNRDTREFSHGCIRIEKPFEFAKYLLRDKPEWTDARIKEAMQAGTEKYVNLTKKLPVYIVYFTTWVDDQGQVNFRNDIYGHDQDLAKAYF